MGFKYHKNDSTVYDALRERGNESHAIRWARKLYSYFDHSNPAEENPSTTVFLLIEELNRFKKQ